MIHMLTSEKDEKNISLLWDVIPSEGLIKEWWFLLKKYNIYSLIFVTMPIISEFGFNLILRILITIYWATGIGNFLARTADPRIDDDAEIFRLNKRNYIFWLTTSLIFFFFWISEFRSQTLVYLTVIEIIVLIIIYTYLMFHWEMQSVKQRKRVKEMKKERLEDLHKWY